jgi:hypothetical protein
MLGRLADIDCARKTFRSGVFILHLCAARGHSAGTPMRTAAISNASMDHRLLPRDAVQGVDGATQAKEARTAPRRPGDGARDGGEAWVCRLAPHEPAGDHGDRMTLALVLPHQHGAGL